MSYSAVAYGISGTPITVAHDTLIIDDISWLRGLLPDPAGANLPLVSTSTTAAAFALLTQAGMAANSVGTSQLIALNVTGAKIAAGTITVDKFAPLTDFLTWSTNLKGVQFSSGGAMFDNAGAPEHTALQAAGGLFKVFNEAGSDFGDILSLRHIFKSGQSILSENGTANLRAQAVGNIMDVVCTDGSTQIFRVNYAEAQPFWKNANKMWHDGNDGAGSGLDADLLDGLDSTALARLAAASNFTVAPTIGGANIWTTANMGVGSGLNADFLDGFSSADFAPVAVNCKIVSGSYVGDGTSLRQITTGFGCRAVIVRDSTSGYIWVSIVTSGGLEFRTTPSIILRADFKLHGSNGFIVESANQSGVTYNYTAWG